MTGRGGRQLPLDTGDDSEYFHSEQIPGCIREEPWGQTVVRVQSPEGSIVGISYAPWLHQ